ncbi:5'-nucleotidase C-terminal domain-containing protein [Tuberibacillus sp. Marseille-P3662]|uniref:5'-nucleotidase C-terminal domain-containing protein n=1 Tax=Tuberibacillus sp. Marseille-P3662 TaxID=1965358 RepID=UPI000A1C8382|nr:5'-nucleotidase C-terminal domain-containing protein [Tuberibacillus sp. Marseille-P3662]
MRHFLKSKLLAHLLVLALVLSNFSSVLAQPASAEETSGPENLIISEYVEGSSYNKAIEIFNGTGHAVDLSNYQIELYSNESETANRSQQLSGNLDSGQTLVIAHSSAADKILNAADTTSGVVNFNGNDAIVLNKDGSPVDIVGTIGSGQAFAKDTTLVRKSSVTSGNTTYDETEWTSLSNDTFSNLGQHEMDGGGTSPDDGAPQEATIQQAKGMSGKIVTVEGVVTADNAAIGGGQLSTYIQDDTAGINVFAVDPSQFPSLEKGDKIRVTGQITSYNQLTEIKPNQDGIKVIEEDASLPQPKDVTIADLQQSAVSEPLEGSLVNVNGYISNIPDSPAGGGYNITFINQDYQATTLRVMEGSLDLSNVEAGHWYDVTAILGQYNDAYQLIPRSSADIALSSEQPEAPTAAGEYTATVDYVTDGDTIHLKNPVLGSDKVRFLNIDTSETYYDGPTDADKSQKEHGEAAKAYMKKLLQSGDKVTIKLGQEPKDDYGRLLAQVIRKSDEKNINLEMVRQGYAVTYFIWPIGDKTVYQKYQSAVRSAKDQGLGIWNPDDPLAELPFVFRAREQGKGLTKYVGNSETKSYVKPKDWEQVPVDKRIFFWDEATAKAEGYTPAFTDQPKEDLVSVQLLTMNDLHGKINEVVQTDVDGDGTEETVGGMATEAAYLKKRAATHPNTLMVHSGDMVGGSPPVSALLHDEPTVEVMEAIGFDVGTVGNHEFDDGVEEMNRLINGGEHEDGKSIEGYDGMNFPMIEANVEYKDTGQPVLNPYSIQEVGGEKIGFIGVITQAARGDIIPSSIENVTFTDEATAVNKYAKELKAKGVESIVVLSHIPGTQNGDTVTGDAAGLAKNIDDEVDVIVSGHNHKVNNGVVDNKLIVQASEYGKAFGDIDLQIDPETGDIVNKKAEVVYNYTNKIEPNPEVKNIIETYKEKVAPITEEVVGQAAIDINGGYANDETKGDNALGNLLADAMTAEMNSDFALMNGGGIRANLPAGPITWGDLYNIQPFGNWLVKLDVTGADMYKILNAQLSETYGPDFSVGGLNYTWSESTDEVVDIFLPNGDKIDPDKTYTLTVNNYMATSTGSSYRPISELGKNAVDGPVDLQATINFVKSFNGEPITYKKEGRIKKVNDDSNHLGEVSLQKAREAKLGSTVTVEGVVTSTPGSWGNKGFYIQDDTAGVYVNQSEYDVKQGDVVKVTAQTREFHGELQLAGITSLEKSGTSKLPKPLKLKPNDLGEDNEGQLVSLKNVRISEIKQVNNQGTFELKVTKSHQSVWVHVDHRTGLSYADFSFKKGDKVNLTGISGENNGTVQLKLRSSEDIVGHHHHQKPGRDDHPVIDDIKDTLQDWFSWIFKRFLF